MQKERAVCHLLLSPSTLSTAHGGFIACVPHQIKKLKHSSTLSGMHTMAQRIHREQTQMSVEHLCEEISDALDSSISEKCLLIPDHQRHAGVWTLSKQQKFITSIHLNHPIPSILMGSINKETTRTLEDGLQRLKTLLDFRNNAISDTTMRHFSEYGPKEQSDFLNYTVTVVKYSGASEEARIQIFDNHQNGTPLKEGERLYAHSATRLVRFTIDMLLTPGMGLYDRFTYVWGPRGGEKDKKNRRKDLHQAVALVAGMVHGPQYITKKYDIIIDNHLLTREFDEAQGQKALTRLLEVYERVQEQCPCSVAWLNKQFDVGQLSGYIVYSMYHEHVISMNDDSAWEPIKEEWIRFLIHVRREAGVPKNMNKVLEKSLHRDVGKARFWTLQRWQLGYLRVFDPEDERLGQVQESEDDTDDE